MATKITLFFDEKLIRALKIAALERGTTASTIAGQAIREFLDRDLESAPAVEAPKSKRCGKGVAA